MSLDVGMLLTDCYVPCIPSIVKRRENMAVISMQGSLVLYTSLGHVENRGTHHLRWKEGEKAT